MKRQLLQISALAGGLAFLPSLAPRAVPAPTDSVVENRAGPLADPRAPALATTAAATAAGADAAAPSNAQPAPRQARPKMDDDDAPKPPPKPRAAAAPANAVTCGGTFVKDTTHLKLAIKYDSRNIVFGEVDGPDGTKIKATILYPNEAKRRLEVIWNNDAARTNLSMVVINGQSQWAAPKGLKLGTQLAALEKINGRPFKLSGFDADGSASVLGWEGGALNSLPGGCRVGAGSWPTPNLRAMFVAPVGGQAVDVQRPQPEDDQACGR